MIDDFKQPSKPTADKTQTPQNETIPPVDTAEDPRVDLDISDEMEKPEPPIKKQRRSPLKWFKELPNGKKAFFVIILALFLLGLSGGAYAYYTKTHQAKPTSVPVTEAPKKAEPPKPTTVASPLTGVQVQPDLAKRPVTGIMIENSPDARPQSGINQAGIVFEAVAEGGITRFLTLFQEAQPDYIGPVRSARPYYAEWAKTFDAAYAHVGGSPDGLAAIKALGVKDLDQFANSGGYWRISQRYAPHNMYTSMAKLDELKNNKGFTSSTFTSFPRKTEAAAATPTARSIDLNISGYLYNPHYDYDPATNSYKRSEGGKPHVDERSNQQLSPKVLVVMVVQQGLAADRLHTTYQIDGSGKVYVFQDGTVTEGAWAKTSQTAQYTFTDAAGQPIKFNPGQTWISLINSPTAVTVK